MMYSRISLVVLLFACFVASPAFAQRQSTGDRLTALEQQLATSRSGNVDLLNQITQLRTEMQSLRSQIEELQQLLEQQKQLGRTQYLDLDGRLNRLEVGEVSPPQAATPSPVSSTPSTGAAAVPKPVLAAPVAPRPVPTTSTVQDTPPRVYGDPATLGRSGDERGAYNAAFDALKAGRYAESSRLFQGFLDNFPNGSYAPNAYYWLGESYYVTQNYSLAQEQFQTLLARYPTHDKAAGAMLKIGLAQYGLRQLDAAEATLAQVVARYPGSEAARTADDRLRAIQLSRVR
jgi:tol-pal system protein YbgF